MAKEFGAYEYKEDCIGDVIDHLKQTNTNYECLNVDDNGLYDNEQFDIDNITQRLDKIINTALFELKSKTNVQQKVNYPQYRRINMVVDLREEYMKDKQNMFTVFEPPTGNIIPKQPHPAELYFDLSRRCLIPRPGITFCVFCVFFITIYLNFVILI